MNKKSRNDKLKYLSEDYKVKVACRRFIECIVFLYRNFKIFVKRDFKYLYTVLICINTV